MDTIHTTANALYMHSAHKAVEEEIRGKIIIIIFECLFHSSDIGGGGT